MQRGIIALLSILYAGCGTGVIADAPSDHALPGAASGAGGATAAGSGSAAGGAGGGASAGGSSGAGGAAKDPHACADIYDEDLLPTFEIDISDAEWAGLQKEFANPGVDGDLKPYHPAVFRYGNEVVNDASVRLKGNPFFSWVPPKMQFVISFNEQNPDGRFHGLRKIALDAAWYDPSLLHERMADTYMRDAGMPGACANSARLVVNGVYYGAYANMEQRDHEFLERVFGKKNADGNLYKYGVDLQSHGGMGDVSHKDQYWAAGTVAAMDAVTDLDQTVAEWAAEGMLPDADGYWCCNHNYYLYDHPKRGFLFIPFDLDYSFDGSPPAIFAAIAVNADPYSYLRDIGAKPPHFLMLMSDPKWRGKFLAAIKAARAAYDVATLVKRVDEWSAQIADAVAQDPNKTFSNDVHVAAVASLRDYISARAAYVDQWLDCSGGQGLDYDGDGTLWCNDCDDSNPAVHPGAPEKCNGVDDDCDGAVDDACSN